MIRDFVSAITTHLAVKIVTIGSILGVVDYKERH